MHIPAPLPLQNLEYVEQPKRNRIGITVGVAALFDRDIAVRDQDRLHAQLMGTPHVFEESISDVDTSGRVAQGLVS